MLSTLQEKRLSSDALSTLLAPLSLAAVTVDSALNIKWNNAYFDKYFLPETKKHLLNLASFLSKDDTTYVQKLLRENTSAFQMRHEVVLCHIKSTISQKCDLWLETLETDEVLLILQPQKNPSTYCKDLLHLTRYDPITQLPNRSYFLELLEQKLHKQKKAQTFMSVLVIDFHEEDDKLFHASSEDEMLLTLKNRLDDIVDEKMLFARVGSSRFALVYDTAVTTTEIEQLAQNILHLFLEPISIKDHLIYADISIGISLYPTDTLDAKSLLKKAEKTALMTQRNEHNSYGFAHKLPEKNIDHIIKISTDLPAAIENGEIYFVFQPQYSHEEQGYCGAELLARWEHPELGFISPEIFIPLAEQTGMIKAVAMKAFVEASKLFKILSDLKRDTFSLSVNVSPSVLLYSGFIEDFSFFIESYGMQGRPLRLEVTENDLAKNFSKMADTLREIRKMGIKIEMDDYGTGYTSLQYLSKLPIDTLKVDRSFVQNIDTDRQQAVLFKAICDMASALGYEIVVEGVETEGENSMVKQYDNIRVQGYYYSRPLQQQDLLELLTSEMPIKPQVPVATRQAPAVSS